MLKYKYTITGKYLSTGLNIKIESWSNDMSKYELDQLIKQHGFDPKTVTFKKEKVK